MIQIIRGKAGSAVKGDIAQFSEGTEKRLIDSGMARKVWQEEMSESDISEPVFLSVEELKKIRSKKDIIKYGASIGCELDNRMPFKDMVNEILNYQEENDISQESNGENSNIQQESEKEENFSESLVNDNFEGPDV